jgi:hypothetical protein
VVLVVLVALAVLAVVLAVVPLGAVVRLVVLDLLPDVLQPMTASEMGVTMRDVLQNEGTNVQGSLRLRNSRNGCVCIVEVK